MISDERRKLFEKLGPEVVEQDAASGGGVHIGNSSVREDALAWLAEKRKKKERWEAFRFWFPIAISLISLTVALLK